MGDSDRHLRSEETSLLLGPADEDRFSVCSIDNSGRHLETDAACTLLEIVTEDVFVIVAYCVGNSERGSKVVEGFVMLFNSNAGSSENPGLNQSIIETNKKNMKQDTINF